MQKKPIVVATDLYRSSAPEGKLDIQSIYGMGIRNVICLQEGWSWKLFRKYRAERDFEKLGGTYWTISWSNFFPPTPDECILLCNLIINPATPGATLIHCKAGVDRTGWLCAFYLMYTGVMKPQEAWEYMQTRGMHWWFRMFWRKAFFATPYVGQNF